ncbi:MAG: ABC transporter ATP-binding protein [Planctomycetota bacterium]
MAFGAGAARVEALRGIDLEVRRGEFVAVTGPSGSGKSTMLHLMAGLARPTAGVVEVDGTDLVALDDDALTRVRRRRIGIVFQAYNLLPVLTALENVALPLELDGVPRATAAERAAAGLARVGLAARAGHLPSELSGGEQQRVAVARALVTSPAVLLADEPTGNLDSANGAAVMALLRSLADDGATLVMVTHEPEEAASARRQVRLVDGRVASDAATAAP